MGKVKNLLIDSEYVQWEETQKSLIEIIKLVGWRNVTFGSSKKDETPGLLIGDPLYSKFVEKGSYIVKTELGTITVPSIQFEAFIEEFMYDSE